MQHRLLIGCEVTGIGRLQPRPYDTGSQAFHVVEKLDSVMARYIFLLPTEEYAAPTSGKVRKAMMAAFGRIRVGLDKDE